METNKTLHLTVDDLNAEFRANPPSNPRFFHFTKKIKAAQFQEAASIIFSRPGAADYVIKGQKVN